MKQKQVKQHNLITQAKHAMTATEMNVMFMLLDKLDENERSKRIYKIDLKELQSKSGKELKLSHLKEATSRLRMREYAIEHQDGSYLQVGILASAEYNATSRTLELELSSKMERFLFDLKENFTIYYLETALQLSSKFSKRIYQMLSQFRATGFYKTTLKKLKEQLGVTESYTKFSAFEKYVLQKAQEELAMTDMSFTYELEKEGRSYKWIIFNFTKGFQKKSVEAVKPESKTEQVPVLEVSTAKEALLHPEEKPTPGKRLVYDRMVGDFNLSPKQVSLIIENFSLAEINQSLYQIQLKVVDGKVQNKASYTAKWFQNKQPVLKLLNSDMLI
jgi:plasmid replication initiation protein